MKKIGETIKRPGALQAAPELVEIQALMPMAPKDRERLLEDIRENGMRDPLKIYTDAEGRGLVLGGWNRLQIALELGLAEVRADIYEGTPKERAALVIQDNLNRRHLTADQKNNLVEYVLKKDPALSDAQVSKLTNTDRKTTRNARKKMEQGGEIPTLRERRGADGKMYKKPDPVSRKKAAPNPATPRPTGPSKGDVKKIILDYIKAARDPRQAARELVEYIKAL